MWLDVLQYVGAGLGIISITLAAIRMDKMTWSMLFGALGGVLLGSYGFITGQYAIAISQSLYVVLYLRGVLLWGNKNNKKS